MEKPSELYCVTPYINSNLLFFHLSNTRYNVLNCYEWMVQEMLDSLSFEKLEENIAFFKEMYDSVRIVDPKCKNVKLYDNAIVENTDETCYHFWGKNQICDNCISARANHERKSFIKLEQYGNKVMMVTVIPIISAEQSYVVELLKDVTDSLTSGISDNPNTINEEIRKLNDLVVTDPLTSLFNRRFVDERLQADIISAVINKWPLSIIFLDIDDFKSINDNYGHDCGDQVLIAVSNAILSCTRNDLDWAARFGGDEFLVCINNKNVDATLTIGERIRQNIESNSASSLLPGLRVSASLGIHTMKNKTLTSREIISLADQNMYQAKQNGKNKIIASVD